MLNRFLHSMARRRTSTVHLPVSVLLGVLVACPVAQPVLAHHSMAEFDRGHPIELTGTVKEWRWTNPHTWIIITVTDSNGVAIDWALESGSPSNLRDSGISRSTIKPGDVVVVKVLPRRDGARGGGLSAILMINGQPGPGAAPTGAPSQ